MKSSEEVREALEEKEVEELEDLVEAWDEKIPEASRRELSTHKLLICRKKAIASSILEDRREGRSTPERSSAPQTQGQSTLGGFA